MLGNQIILYRNINFSSNLESIHFKFNVESNFDFHLCKQPHDILTKRIKN